MTFWDTVIVIGVVGFFLFSFYKVLKEPLDRFFELIKNLFIWLKDEISNSASSAPTHEVIRYG